MKLEKKWKPAALTSVGQDHLHLFEEVLGAGEGRPIVVVAYEESGEPEDRLTPEEVGDRWMVLVGTLQGLRQGALFKGEERSAEMLGSCIALCNELAADRAVAIASNEARRKQSST